MWIRQMIPCQAVTSVQSHTWKAGTLRQHEKLEIFELRFRRKVVLRSRKRHGASRLEEPPRICDSRSDCR